MLLALLPLITVMHFETAQIHLEVGLNPARKSTSTQALPVKRAAAPK
jgi:hypothetical protein